MTTNVDMKDAIMSRISVRDFIPDKVPPLSLIIEILQKSTQNIGIDEIKWKVYVLHGPKHKAFVKEIQNRLNKGQLPMEQEYNIYPPKLKLKYHKRRKKLAQDMYKLLDIPYKDKWKRFQHLKKNWSFFNAPIGLLFTMDNAPNDLIQFCHLGMYLQNVMLLLQQHGIDSCAQEAWANYSKTVHELLDIDKKELLFCGMSVGYRNPNAKVNTLRSDRMELDEFVHLPSKL